MPERRGRRSPPDNECPIVELPPEREDQHLELDRKRNGTPRRRLLRRHPLSFVVVLSIWVAALWKPLPIEAREAAPPSDSTYQRLSPEINVRLRELNEKLLRLWKLEALPQ